MFVKLGLLTNAQREDFVYGKISVPYTDFKQASLRYLSENGFDKCANMCCLYVQDGKITQSGGHGLWIYKSLRSVTYLGATGKQYWYKIEVNFESFEDVYLSTAVFGYELAFVLENGDYVIDDIRWVSEIYK